MSEKDTDAPDGKSNWKLTVDQLRLTDDMELAAHPVRLAASDVKAQASLERTDRQTADRSWLDADGNRYQAMLVLEDGTAFGRKGPAPKPQRMPTGENNYGGWRGVDPSDEEVERAVRDLEEAEMAPAATDSATPRAERPESQLGILGGSLAADRRFRITSLSTLQGYPNRTIGALNQSTAAGAESTNQYFPPCTGTRVGPRHVLTAAHCVLRADGTWISSGWFHPGQTNSTHPNAGGTAIRWSGVYARDYGAGPRWDYALVYLEDRQNSYNLGWVGMYWWGDGAGYAGQSAFMWGYPAKTWPSDHGRCLGSLLTPKNCDGWMYGDSSRLVSSDFRADEELQFDIDGTSAQSGSSVLWGSGGGWSTLGVYWGSLTSSSGWPNGKNRAARMRTSMHADVCDWINNVTSVWGANPC